MGRRDWFNLGDHNAICYVCGFKRKASEMRLRWDGVYVCQEDFEIRQPQDFVKGAEEEMAPAWTQPEVVPDQFTGVNVVPTGNIVVGTPTIFVNGVAQVSGVDYTIQLPQGYITFINTPVVGATISWTGSWLDNAGNITAYTNYPLYSALGPGFTNYSIYGTM